MKITKNSIKMGFTNEHLPELCHVCLIFENEEQRQKIVTEYLAAGLKNGEIVRYFSDKTASETLETLLSEQGINISEVEEDGTFAIFKAEAAYCPNGQFDPQKTIDSLKLRYAKAKKEGYSGSRACGEMSWALKGIPGSERLLEYEVLLNTVIDPFPHTGMCQYDARLFDGVTLFKVLQTHPYIIAQGQVVQNPYYIRPEEFKA